MSKSDKDFFYDIYIDDFVKLDEGFPYIQRSSIFIMTFSLFENELNTICKILGRNSNLELQLKDLNGKGIERAKLYLEKVVKINFPANSKSWGEITNFSRIRNFVVHNGGRLKEKGDKNSEIVKKYIKKNSTLNFDGHERISYNENFIPHVLDTFHKFSNVLFSNIDKSWNI